jgi:hypothetical protein
LRSVRERRRSAVSTAGGIFRTVYCTMHPL